MRLNSWQYVLLCSRAMVHIWTQGDMILEVATRPICFLPSNPTFEYKIYQHSEIIQYPKNERFIKSLIKVGLQVDINIFWSWRKIPEVYWSYRKIIEVTRSFYWSYQNFIEVTGSLWKLPEVTGRYWKLPKVTIDCLKLPKKF